MSVVTVGAILLGFPPLYAIYAAMHHPEYASVKKALNIEPMHRAVFSMSGLALSVFFAYVFRTKLYKVALVLREHMVFLAGLLITAFLVVNQQVITGMTLQHVHYFRSFNNPIFAIVLMFLAYVLFKSPIFTSPRARFAAQVLPWCTIFLLMVTGVYFQYTAYQIDAPIVHEEQRYMPPLRWLSHNVPKGSVVMANDTLSELIPLFTSHHVVWQSVDIPGVFLYPSERAQFTPENLLQSKDFLSDIKKYRVDYILWDRKADPEWKIDAFKLPVLFSSEDMEIYELP